MGIAQILALLTLAGYSAAEETESVERLATTEQNRNRIEMFRKADVDGDGAVTQDELLRVAPKLSPDRFRALDKNQDGRLDRQDFPRNRPENGQAINQRFRRADSNQDGKLTYNELRHAYPNVTEAQFGAMDANGDGALSTDEAAVASTTTEEKNGMRSALLKSDGNNDGQITFDELSVELPSLTKVRFEQMDRNGDGILTRADKDGHPAGTDDTGGEAQNARRKAAKKLMETDRNADGQVSLEEVWAAKPGFPEDAFARYDRNQDGQISPVDFD